MRLIMKLALGIVIGIVVGLIVPEFITRIIVTFKEIFGQFLEFTIPLIIIFFIVSGIASFGKQSGKMLGLTSLIAYSSTILAGILAFIVALIFIPMLAGQSGGAAEEAAGFEPFFEFTIDPITGVMTALVAAFVFGIGITRLNSPTLKSFFDEGKEIIERMIWKIIIPILPFYIGSIFAELAADGTVLDTLRAFGLVLVLAVAVHWVWITILFTAAGAFIGRNPFSALKTMLPAYFTGLGTMSSAATIPVTVRQSKKNDVSDGVADSAVPLSATIHLSGSTITLVLCSVAVMVLSNDLSMPTFGMMLPFIITLGIIMIAAPGVPGGAVIAALGLLTTMLGFDETALGLMIGLYMAQDSLGTAANVTGDGAIALIVDKMMNKK
ncbi:Na+/H+-dicarboxylate symporter [Virgibacillus natechei]|uniref:Na+/H+-dicarboxylate symporter n=1 Tax=Virgibacillus natechei TaxID=1216297 RepID=A0ABS4IKE2_9BACI|nr:dicarboxylate/amino acid:cation symporter [Virgibacillus natechei]MBP1971401.1 Na+/H+-dicarboxylate symporter [Virgibacillus natechei]UZD12231.1 dicarboxylate/amino acid:cation symporter [Virgibacillus natechei]